jgi:Cu(I)/Ag(I) efflux system membrane fusion protein
VEGWVEKLYVNKTGQSVRRGETLLELYSPQLVAGQEEYLLALDNAARLADSPFAEIREGAARLAEAAHARLRLLDVPEAVIRELAETRRVRRTVPLHSPFRGIVTHINVREGQYVMPQTELYRIADLSRVWVYVDLYEDDLAWVREGDTAEMQVTALPGRRFQGKVATIYPYLEAKTRTGKVRLEFANPDRALKPEMYASVIVHASRQVDAVTVPAEAIVRSGARSLVFVVRGPGKFAPREVETGVSAAGRTQILHGLEPGEEVVVSAQFLIDSESKLREAVAKMLEADRPAAKQADTPAHRE